ncbi:MAG TPA: tannase/feruloyl esterase family alpha/beta hydrolase, partial [Steroidobacteraceae bacterium]
PGPNNFDAVAALDQWRQHGQAPETLVASKYPDSPAAALGFPTGEPLSTRPLCAYPHVAHWTGKGSYDEAKNYVCR